MLIVANWKTYVGDLAKAKDLFTVSKRLARAADTTVVLAPPATLLGVLAHKNTSDVLFAAQDVSAITGGAHTGEITAQAYTAAGATYTIVGHSERRAAGDTNAIVSAKIAHALAQKLIPILCVGELERDSEGGYLTFIREELTAVFASLTQKERRVVIVAYEPVWAIGKTSSEAITAADLAEMILYIRKVLADFLPGKSAMHATILYGGSVEPGNARSLAAESGVVGFLVGHASVDPHTFSELVKNIS